MRFTYSEFTWSRLLQGDSAPEHQIAEVSSTLSSALCSLAELRMSRADDLVAASGDCITLLKQVRHYSGPSG